MLRARLYVEAGADAIVIHSRHCDPSEVMTFAAAWEGGVPLVLIPSTYPQLTIQQAALAGTIGMIIYANHGLRASIAAMERVFREILCEGGSALSDEWITPLVDVFKLQNDPRTQRM
jgi:phosphoenolpyruvate phosphomutase